MKSREVNLTNESNIDKTVWGFESSNCLLLFLLCCLLVQRSFFIASVLCFLDYIISAVVCENFWPSSASVSLEAGIEEK